MAINKKYFHWNRLADSDRFVQDLEFTLMCTSPTLICDFANVLTFKELLGSRNFQSHVVLNVMAHCLRKRYMKPLDEHVCYNVVINVLIISICDCLNHVAILPHILYTGFQNSCCLIVPEHILQLWTWSIEGFKHDVTLICRIRGRNELRG